VRSMTETLCGQVTEAEQECFKHWCNLFDRRGRANVVDVVASQTPLHEAAEDIRAWCLADREQAEAERLELLRSQVEGEMSAASAIRVRCHAGDRDAIRQRWNGDRWQIVSWRDALTIGLGWPHRGERVTVTVSCWYGDLAGEVTVTGTGIYLSSNDVYNATHLVWVPQTSSDRHRGTKLVAWEYPGASDGPLANADPAGDIAMRVMGAQSRRLPVPLPRWPKAEDIVGGVDPLLRYAVGEQMDLFS
jgi:hypothetical protein